MMLNRPAIFRLFAAICLLLVTACPGWGADNIIRPLIGNEILGSRDVIGSATNGIIDPVPIFVYQPERSWISAHADGIKTTTYARTSSQTYVDTDGVLRTVPANTPAVENCCVTLEGAATSYYWQPYTESGGAITAIEAPVTRTVTLPSAGNYVLWIDGNASLSVTVAANTAAGSGWGTLTESGSLNLSITTAGTVDVTVSDGAANDIVQLTKSAYKTSYIPTPTSTPVTRTTSASDTSGNGLQMDLTQAALDSLRGEMIDWSKAGTFGDSGNDSAYIAVTLAEKKLVFAGTYTNATWSKANVIPTGGSVEVSYTITGRTVGQFRLYCGPYNGPSKTGNGSYVERVSYSNSNYLGVAGQNNFDGSVTINYCRRVLDSGQTNPGAGTVLCGVYLPWPSSVIPNDVTIIPWTVFNSTTSSRFAIRRNSSGTFFPVYLSDGVTGTQSPAMEINAGYYVLIAQFSARTAQMRVGLYNPATSALTWGSSAAYRGFFPIHSSNKLRWFYGGTIPLGIGGCAIYDTILTDDEIIRAAQALQ